MNKFLAIWLAPILVLSGCATIMGESSQTVPIKSQPSGSPKQVDAPLIAE